MLRLSLWTPKWSPPAVPAGFRITVLLALARALVALAERIERHGVTYELADREFEVQVIGGRPRGAVYENGRLVGWVDITRL